MIGDIVEEIKLFLFQGSVINLLIAIIIGKAFAELIQSTVSNVILPLIFSVFGKIELGDMSFKIGKMDILYGKSLDLLFTLIISILTLYFIFIKPFNSIIKQNDEKKEEKNIKLIKKVVEEIKTIEK